MSCKNLKLKSKKGTKYLYCDLKKEQITFADCKHCANKEYKIQKCTIKPKNCAKYNFHEVKKPIKGKKHKLTKATSISMKVKKEVWERDNYRCIYCRREVPIECANSHFIKRSQLGKGIPQNIVSACSQCHDKYDFGINVQAMINYTREYLKSKYEDWNEEDLKYKKR